MSDAPAVRFNHMELTFPPGTLSDGFRADVADFYADVLGWESRTVDIVGQQGHYLLTNEAKDFILLLEHAEPMNRPRYDHLGLLVEDRAAVDELRARAGRWAETDERVEIIDYDDLVVGPTTVHAFYFRFLLPIHFDVQCIEVDG